MRVGFTKLTGSAGESGAVVDDLDLDLDLDLDPSAVFVHPARVPLDPAFVAGCPYGPEGLLIDEILQPARTTASSSLACPRSTRSR